jgi:anti-anti-sigma regulatory factor
VIQNWQDFVLHPDFKAATDRGLRDFLLAHRASPVRIDLSALRKLPTDLVELLLTAAVSWQKGGVAFALCGVSAASEQRLTGLGITAELLQRGIKA